jgi:hypothetical protein
MSTMGGADERVRWAASLRAQHPDNPLYALLDAQALLGKDTPEAIRLADSVGPSIGLPRNWRVDAKGKLQWEQFGYGPNQRWEAMITS